MIELRLLPVSKTPNWRISDWGGQSAGEDDTLHRASGADVPLGVRSGHHVP
jgi:hypothetical protein